MLRRGWKKRLAQCLIAVVALGTTVLVAEAPANASIGGGWTDPVDMSTPYASWLASGCDGQTAYDAGIYHTGRDFGASVGTAVKAIGPGKVKANLDFGTGYARAVFVQHTAADGTNFLVLYGHINSSIAAGTVVNAGDQVGTVAQIAYPPYHLHLGLIPGTSYPSSNWGRMPCASWPATNGFVDPIAFLGDHPLSSSGGTTPPPQRMMILNSDGVAYAKDALALDGWTQVTSFGGVSKIAVGGKRMVIQTSDGNLWGKDDISLGTEGWQLLASFTNISAFAVSSTGRIMILNSLGVAYAKNSLGLDGWTTETNFGGVQRIAVGGNRLMIQTDGGYVYAKDDPTLSLGADGWAQQTSFSGVSAIGVGSTGRMMILNTTGIAYAKDSLGLDGWTTLSGFGGITNMAVNGGRMAIRTTGGLYAKDQLVTDSWWTQADFPIALPMAVGNAGRIMMTTSAATYAKDGIGDGWTQVTFFSGITAIAVG